LNRIVIIKPTTASTVRWRDDTLEKVADRFQKRKEEHRPQNRCNACTTEKSTKKQKIRQVKNTGSGGSGGRRELATIKNHIKQYNIEALK